MKEAVFEPQWYCDPRYAEMERKNLFEKLWLTAGFVSTLKHDGDYFTFSVYGREIVVHRLRNDIVAYLNICPHRGGVMVTSGHGNTRPVCKYHGWAFRSGGALTGIPMARDFDADENLRGKSCGRSLQRVAVQIVGPVIFVNLSENPLPIDAQFSEEILGWVRRMGSTSSAIQAEFPGGFNWKLNAENIRDALHVLFVHPSSFSEVMPDALSLIHDDRVQRVQETPSCLYESFVPDVPSLHRLSLTTNSHIDEGSYWYDDLVERSMPKESFLQIVLFPNTNLYSVAGRYYGMQQYLPKSASDFHYRLSLAMPRMLRPFDASSLLLSIARSERYVIEEDSLILRRVQKNLTAMAQHRFRFTQGDYETPIMQFMRYMGCAVYQENQTCQA
ncbi:aromatic ring-hydroxylating oxygenase subunit alpha [Bordetella holmesii]|uniref:aromatic ring-hydroxylating oxygenase subunit alpha n=1 Tax=Bordetella holmesii TaxID=35814 RepID=UPI000C7667C9|nr:Rieske 2Fe-2S domain-containing protein [Bordetella holmesii]AUL31745.1 ring-hydroxylating oxygenase subunit alpha [Bordetella holmesii]